MEQNLPIVAKKFWKTVRVMYFLLMKGISKGKLLADLNMALKRAKIAGKLAVINNLMFHHHASAASSDHHISYDFPTFHLPFHLKKRKNHHVPSSSVDDNVFMAAAIEIVKSAAASPLALPGFRPVRQVRVTDSPFPLRESYEGENNYVDGAAEEFIMKFYRNLKQQND